MCPVKCPITKTCSPLPAKEKLTEGDVRRARRRVRRGARITDVATEYGVNRRTIRRRLNALEQAAADEAKRKAANRLRRQAAAERRKLRSASLERLHRLRS